MIHRRIVPAVKSNKKKEVYCMSSKSDLAVAHFHSGLNCAQSVVAVFCEEYGMDKIALKMCSGLCAGIRSGELCGTVSGAVLVIGVKYGQGIAEDKTAKETCNAKTVEFMNLFRTKNKSVVCHDILELDLSIKE